MELSAVILSGGQSTRMGQDKAGLVLEGQTFLERLMAQLGDIPDIYLSVGKADRYAGCPVPHIADEYPGCGPISGIQKALTVCRNDCLFVTACDMPYMDSSFAFYLSGFLTDEADAVIPVGMDGRTHVLGAIYRKRVRPVLEAQLGQGDRRLMNVLEKIRVAYVPIENPEQERKLMNINRPQEYQGLLK